MCEIRMWPIFFGKLIVVGRADESVQSIVPMPIRMHVIPSSTLCFQGSLFLSDFKPTYFMQSAKRREVMQNSMQYMSVTRTAGKFNFLFLFVSDLLKQLKITLHNHWVLWLEHCFRNLAQHPARWWICYIRLLIRVLYICENSCCF
jgi:hypothetical protein